jgi:hypothetical protein
MLILPNNSIMPAFNRGRRGISSTFGFHAFRAMWYGHGRAARASVLSPERFVSSIPENARYRESYCLTHPGGDCKPQLNIPSNSYHSSSSWRLFTAQTSLAEAALMELKVVFGWGALVHTPR